jgi:hypothetical protein
MVEVIITFLGVLQRKLNAREIRITFESKNGGWNLRTILTSILEKLANKTERENFKKWVFDPAKPDQLNPEMAYLIEGKHLKTTKESLDRKINKNVELVIFPPDAGG